MKKHLVILFSACIVLTLAGCSKRTQNRDYITSLFEKKETLFLEAVEIADYSKIEKLAGVRKVNISDSCVEFDFGGAGFGSETSYYGIFYSPEDNLFAPYGTGPVEELTEYEEGYLYQETPGDNRYYVESLGDHFYYYESHF